MANLTADTTAAEIVEDVRRVLETATGPDGQRLFTAAKVYDDLGTFQNGAGALAGKPVAAVIPRLPALTGQPQDASELYTQRLEITVAFRFTVTRAPGASEQPATAEGLNLGAMVQQLLLRDRTRGGKASLIEWQGQLISGTEIQAQASVTPTRGAETTYTGTVPVVCGWAKLRA